MDDKERIAWAINWIKKDRKTNNYRLSKSWGVDNATVARYSGGRGIAKGPVLSSLVKDYGFNGEWLISGKGEPFPGAHDNYPEVCGPPGITKDQEDHITSYIKAQLEPPPIFPVKAPEAMFSSDQKINIEEAMGKTYKVLTAGTALSVALFMNIQQFAAALDTGEALKLCQDQMKAMQEQINTLNARIDGLTAPSIAERQVGAGSEKEVM
ncbi:MAG: hypothetical protein ABFD50_00570 [Smithella sp.]